MLLTTGAALTPTEAPTTLPVALPLPSTYMQAISLSVITEPSDCPEDVSPFIV